METQLGVTKSHGDGNKTPRIEEIAQSVCGQQDPCWGESTGAFSDPSDQPRSLGNCLHCNVFYCCHPCSLRVTDSRVLCTQDVPDLRTGSPAFWGPLSPRQTKTNRDSRSPALIAVLRTWLASVFPSQWEQHLRVRGKRRMPGRARNWFGRKNLREASCIFFVPGNWCTPDLVTQDLGAVWPSRVLQATRPHPHPSLFPRGHQLLETPRTSLRPHKVALRPVPPRAPPAEQRDLESLWPPSEPLPHPPRRPWALSSSLVAEGTLMHPQCTQAFSLTRHTYRQTLTCPHRPGMPLTWTALQEHA